MTIPCLGSYCALSLALQRVFGCDSLAPLEIVLDALRQSDPECFREFMVELLAELGYSDALDAFNNAMQVRARTMVQ